MLEWGNPLEGDGLISLASGIIASDDVKGDLLRAHDIGSEALRQFEKYRLETRTLNFSERIKNPKLKTFTVKKSASSFSSIDRRSFIHRL